MANVRLKQGRSLLCILELLIKNHPEGLKRKEIQIGLVDRLGVGESVGGINRHLRKLRSLTLVIWDQPSYTYKLAYDFDSMEFFIRVVESLGLTTDQGFFLSLLLRPHISTDANTHIDDYLGYLFDKETNDNLAELEEIYRADEVFIQHTLSELMKQHNAYVRLRLFKTANESFLRDLGNLDPGNDVNRLSKAYLKNISSIDSQMKKSIEGIFRLRESIITSLREKRLSKRMKMMIRFSLNHVRPSHVFDGMI